MTEALTAEDVPASPGRAGGFVLSAWCIIAAFGTYFCMYAFRRPFAAGTYSDVQIWTVAYKPVLITSQVFGYALAKFLGIKVIAELQPHRRAFFLVGLIACAEAALLLFALTPTPFNFVWLFFNGLSLGMVFGLVLGFLEGRRQTEALTAGLCTSFIVADGVTRSVGAWLLEIGVSEYWMPVATGLFFFPPLLFFTWMLTRIPAPSAQDVAARSERVPMNRQDRWRFFWHYATGLVLLVSVFLLITILRSVRSDFTPEIWKGLGFAAVPGDFARSELAVAACVLVLNGSAILIRDNRRAFFTGLALALVGTLLVVGALLGLRAGRLSPFAFMVLEGLGLYLPYIAVHTTLFERLIALTRDRGNLGYLMYLADAFGYLGYAAVLVARYLAEPGEHFMDFFVTLSWIIAGVCFLLLIPCGWYFAIHPATRYSVAPDPRPAHGAEPQRSAS